MAREREVSRLSVRIGSNVEEALQGMDRVSRRARRMGRSMQRVGSGLQRNVTLPLLAAGGAMTTLAVRSGNAADELLDLEEQTQLSTDALQEYRRVATVAGTEQDAVARAAEQMRMRLSRGAEGSADMRRALDELGISARNADGSLRPMGEVVEEAIAELSGMEDATRRNVLATQLFSRAADDLAPILGLGRDQIAEIREEAHEMGEVFSRDALEGADLFRQEVDGLRREFDVLLTQVGIDAIPLLQSLVERIRSDVVPTFRGWAAMLRQIDAETAMTVVRVGALAAALGPMISIAGRLTTSLTGLVGALRALQTASMAAAGVAGLGTLAATLATGGVLLAGVVAGVVAFRRLSGAISDMADSADRAGDRLREIQRMSEGQVRLSRDLARSEVEGIEDRIAAIDEEIAAREESTGAALRGRDSRARAEDAEIRALKAKREELEGEKEDAQEVLNQYEDQVQIFEDQERAQRDIADAINDARDGVENQTASLTEQLNVLERAAERGVRRQEVAARLAEIQQDISEELAAGVDDMERLVTLLEQSERAAGAFQQALGEDMRTGIPEGGMRRGRMEMSMVGEEAEGLTQNIREGEDAAEGMGRAIEHHIGGAIGTVSDQFTAFIRGAEMDVGRLVDTAVSGFVRMAMAAGMQRAGLDIPGFASGGHTQGGRPIIVGERGPELFVPSTAGEVVPNHELRGGGGGGMSRADLPPYPAVMSPEALAVDTYWRKFVDAALDDASGRGRRD